jgi:glycerate 2-kinase
VPGVLAFVEQCVIVSCRRMMLTRSDIRSAYDAAVMAAEPRSAVSRAMSFENSLLTVGSHSFEGVASADVVVIALGKAAPAMAWGAYDVLGRGRGLVVTTEVADVPFAACVGSHPIPDQASLRCGEAMVSFAGETRPSDVVVFLISGGGSAVATLPIEGITIGDISVMNSLLIASGVPIEDINEVRASVSRLKGGRLAEATVAKRQVTLVLSDVVGAGPEHVASGPSLGFGLGLRARSVLETAGLQAAMPPTVVDAADIFVPPDRPAAVNYTTIGSPSIAAEAAVSNLVTRGFKASVLTTDLTGEARLEAVALTDMTPPGSILVAAGETTVTVRGEGIGGRNQEAALAAALHVDGQDVLFGAFGTDGIDGPTLAAGAIVDGETVSKAREASVDLDVALRNNDSHAALTVLGETVVTGPSGTNVADLWISARGPY